MAYFNSKHKLVRQSNLWLTMEPAEVWLWVDLLCFGITNCYLSHLPLGGVDCQNTETSVMYIRPRLSADQSRKSPQSFRSCHSLLTQWVEEKWLAAWVPQASKSSSLWSALLCAWRCNENDEMGLEVLICWSSQQERNGGTKPLFVFPWRQSLCLPLG